MSSLSDSFVNISLEESLYQAANDSQADEVETSLESKEATTQTSDASSSPKGAPNESEHDHQATNEELDRLGKQLMEDYAKYYRLNTGSQVAELNECIDNLLTHMEEFFGLIEMIRSDSNCCLDLLTTTVHAKVDQCKQLFRMIDKLERIVRHISLQLSLMDREVSKAEKMMGKKNAVSKLFSLISNPSSSGQAKCSSYVPPDIFKTEDIMKL